MRFTSYRQGLVQPDPVRTKVDETAHYERPHYYKKRERPPYVTAACQKLKHSHCTSRHCICNCHKIEGKL